MCNNTKNILECDYLVIGAGAAPLAFIDTLLTELPDTKVIMIDKKDRPGGHWVHAYDFVRLHQPSVVYGVSSKQLEGNWLKTMATKFTLPWQHRATKQEILDYFASFVDEKIKNGQLEFYPNCAYDFASEIDDGVHRFSTVDGIAHYEVKVNVKLVNGTAGECIIPSQSPLQFPVDKEIRVVTPNQLYEVHMEGRNQNVLGNKYVILGAGKTAMDSICFLQRQMKVKAEDIAWIISNDVWMLRLEGNGHPWLWPRMLLMLDGDVDKACEALEGTKAFTRLDQNIKPTKFRFPVIPDGELRLLQRITTIVRRGRATAIRKHGEQAIVEFGDQQPMWTAFAPADKCVFVHATSPGPFNGNSANDVFVNDKSMTLNLLTAPPISSSMSSLAKLEAARRNGTLDYAFARRLLLASEDGQECPPSDSKYSENQLLKETIHGYTISSAGIMDHIRPIVTLGMFFGILDEDPMVAYNWMKTNRLSFLSIPGFKCQIYEDITLLYEKGKALGYTDNDIRMFKVLAEKLEPLKGM